MIADQDDTKEEGAKYLITLVKRGSIARLHEQDGCWRARGLVFENYEWVDLDSVPPEMYTAFCRDCWADEVPEIPLDLKIIADLGTEDIVEEDSDGTASE